MQKSNILSKDIGTNIKNARLKKKMTQLQLAEQVGTYQPSIAKLEAGKNLPSLQFLSKIAKALDKRIEVKLRV